MRLINADALYKRTDEREASALVQVKKTILAEDKTEWELWTAILNERTALKQDVANAPTIDAKIVEHGKWEFVGQMTNAPVYKCTVCKKPSYAKHDWCPRCGAKMDLNEVES